MFDAGKLRSWQPRLTILASLASAGVLLALPLTTAPTPVFRGLTYPQVELLVLTGIAAGWLLADRLAAWQLPPWAPYAVAAGLAVAGLLAVHTVVLAGGGFGRTAVVVTAPSLVAGSVLRGGGRTGQPVALAIVAIAAVTSWLTYDLGRLPYAPLRDLHLYLGAADQASQGISPYLDAPLSDLPDPEDLPFVYPPFSLPVFQVLAGLPGRLVDLAWLATASAAALAGLRVLGVRGRWLILLLAWPPLAIGVMVGNVAPFTFLLLAVGFRAGAALVVGGAFKPQSAIPALWLVREGRWRALGVGLAVVAAVVLVTLPMTGWQAWVDWLASLGHFQASAEANPGIKGFSITRWFPSAVLAVATVVAVGLALLARGRNGLARLAVASVIASPTLYVHGLAPLLPGILALPPVLLWFTLGLGPWVGPGASAWVAIAIVGVALMVIRGEDLVVRAGPGAAERELHPAGPSERVWP